MSMAKWLLVGAVVFGLAFAGVRPASADAISGVLVRDGSQYAFVGWYGAFEFPTTEGQTWTILLDVVKTGTGNSLPSATKILMFTADGSSNPDHAGNLDAGIIYNRLDGEGYNVDVANQADITTMSNFSAYDLVLYPNLDDHSAANVVASGVHFITMEPGQTDEMGIGTGVSVFNGLAQTFYVDGTGETLSFDNAVRTEAIEPAGDGQVEVSLTEVPEPGTMMLLMSGISGLAWLRRRKACR